jgi:hypothetical protein
VTAETSTPKPRREIKVDLSGLTDRQAYVRGMVIRFCERAYGPRWQSMFAADLTKEAGRRIAQNQVSQWISGDRPVPEALFEPIRRLAVRTGERMRRHGGDIVTDWAKAPSARDVKDAQAAR